MTQICDLFTAARPLYNFRYEISPFNLWSADAWRMVSRCLENEHLIGRTQMGTIQQSLLTTVLNLQPSMSFSLCSTLQLTRLSDGCNLLPTVRSSSGTAGTPVASRLPGLVSNLLQNSAVSNMVKVRKD